MRLKCRLPADAWPATPGRNWCSASSAIRSPAHSAIRSGGTQTSSMISDVPSGRSRPVRPKSPSRTIHANSISSGSRVNAVGRSSSRSRSSSSAVATCASSAPSSSPPYSTSSAADSGGSSFQYSGDSGHVYAAAISAGATISSHARAPAATRPGTGSAAASTDEKWIHDVVVRAGTGRVSKTASATNANVPSDPTTRRRKISSGVSASRNAHNR